MIVSINQPAYMPWLGYFDRILKSDLHIVLDHVQFEKNSVVNRNKIKTASGWSWISVPVLTKGRFGNLPINEIEISNHSSWTQKHLRTLRMNYSRSPFFSHYIECFNEILDRDWRYLNDLNKELTDYIMGALGVSTDLVFSSKLSPRSKKSDLILELCSKVGASTYLSGPFGRDYLDVDQFESNGINVIFHDYIHPHYQQLYDQFEPNMSVLDLLFNHGSASVSILAN